MPQGVPHGAGLSLYHIRQAALTAEVLSPSTPTAISATFDTRLLPERTLQSDTRPSNSNLRSVLQTFARDLPPGRHAYYGPPARILVTLLHNHIIPRSLGRSAGELRAFSGGIGLSVSLRTVQRVLRGEVARLEPVPGKGRRVARQARGAMGDGGPVLALGGREKEEIADILRRAARAGYLEIEDVKLETRPGEISLRARVYEPEEEYE